TTHAGNPFLHFWCQVKVSQGLDPASASQSYSASDDELAYWLSQPIPTFLCLVPDRRGEQPPIYLCSPLVRTNNSMASLTKLSTFQELKDFLRDSLPYWTFIWELHHG